MIEVIQSLGDFKVSFSTVMTEGELLTRCFLAILLLALCSPPEPSRRHKHRNIGM